MQTDKTVCRQKHNKRRFSMKKTFAFIIVIALFFTLCSCKSANNDISNNSSDVNPAFNSTTNDESSTDDVTSELENIDASSNVPSDTPSEPVPSTPSNVVSSEPIADGTHIDEPVEDEKPKEEPINFIPSRTNDHTIDLYYKDVAYASVIGKNNGVDCRAVVTLDDNGGYLKCIYVFDTKNNEQAKFNIYNDRIYYYKYMSNDARDYVLLNDFAICSVNLSGTDKRIEKKLDISFTHAMAGEPQYYLNSKYLFFDISNLFDGIYDVIYRYNIETKEMVELDYKLETHNTIYSIGERVFVWNYSENNIYEYDINLKNEKLFHKVGNPHQINSLVVSLRDNGFLLHHWEREDRYLLDFSGNLTQIS